MEVKAIVLSADDNVAVVLDEVKAGGIVLAGNQTLKANENIPRGHKISIELISENEMIRKYGLVIGRASRRIEPGDWVHSHNVIDITDELCDAYAKAYRAKNQGEDYGNV